MSGSISLLIPCFNAENYIDNFIHHLNTFELKFDEVIFYNDGSNDGTLEILKKYRYKYLNSYTNHGPGYARNRLAEAATFDYIHFHDIDDLFDPNFIAIISQYMPAKPDVIVGNADWIYEQTGKIIEWRYNEAEASKDPLSYFISHPLGIINTVYRKEAFLAIGGFNENIKCWEDSDLHTRLAANDYNFAFANKVLAYSIRHNNGLSNNQDWCWQCRLKFLEQYLETYPAKYTDIILEQISRCAQAFYSTKMISDFNKSVTICKRYGLHLPISKKPFINILKRLRLPPRFIFDVIAFYKKLSL